MNPFRAVLLLASLSVASAAHTPSRYVSLAARDNSTANSTGNGDPMYQISQDPDFHFEILRVLSMAPYEGSDIGEVLVAANQIQPADFESFYNAFNNLAERVQNVSTSIDATRHPISARNAFFKASSYFRSADFFLHGNWSDPRINTLWDQQLSAFNSALELMPIPGQRLTLNASGFQVPAVFYSSGLPGKRPTIIMCNGYDGSQEEMYHVLVKAVVERGMNAITYEGPGMPTVRRQQDLGFIPNWEAVVTPVVDWAVAQPQIDPTSIGLWGFCFGGYLAPRAAAFEHRIAAVLALDGVYDAGSAWLANFPAELLSAFHDGDATAVNEGVTQMLASPDIPTSAKWGVQQGMWSFKKSSAYDWLVAVQNYTLKDVVQNIKAPVFVGEAQNDQFFTGQGKRLADHLGDLATYHFFTNAEGAGEHCSIGAQVFENQVALDWFEDVVRSNGCNKRG